MARHRLILTAVLLVGACAPGDVLPRSFATGSSRMGTALGPLEAREFRVLAHLDVGRSPRQIVFTRNGRTGYVAVAGSGRVVRMDVIGLKTAGSWKVPGAPTGLFVTPDQRRLGVSCFGSSRILVYRLADDALVDSLATPAGPSFFAGPYADNTWFLAARRADRVVDIDGAHLETRFTIETGRWPSSPAATRDGLEVFTPEADDGTVSIFDLEKGRAVGRVVVGPHPSGGTVLSDGTTYAVAVRGADRVAFISGVFYRLEGEIRRGIGDAPASVLMARGGRMAFVDNLGSDDISVLSVEDRTVATRIPVGGEPVAMAVTPDGSELWVSCAGSRQVWVLSIPVRLR
jgi:YVTN family beta-propeller protein